jgi:hypothetical protein
MGQRARRREALKHESPLAIISGVVTIVAAVTSPIIAGLQGLALSGAIVALAVLVLVFWHVRPQSPRRQRARELGLVLLALVAGALLFVVVDWKSITTSSPNARPAHNPDLRLEAAEPGYLLTDQNQATVIDLRLRNDGDAESAVNKVNVTIERITRIPVPTHVQRCHRRRGRQCARGPEPGTVYTMSLTGARAGEVLSLDLGFVVAPRSPDRLALAVGASDRNSVYVARLAIELTADSGRRLDTGPVDVLVESHAGSHRLSEQQLARIFAATAVLVASPRDIQNQLRSLGLPVPSWLPKTPEAVSAG